MALTENWLTRLDLFTFKLDFPINAISEFKLIGIASTIHAAVFRE